MKHLGKRIIVLSGLVLMSSTGMAQADATYHAIVHDTENQVVHSTDGNCVRTKWMTDQGACAPQGVVQEQPVIQQVVQKTVVVPPPQVRTADKLTQDERTVYFKFNRSALTPEGKQRLDTLASVLKADQSVKDAKIVGYADRIGSISYNEKLSQNRAKVVRDYLIANGYTNASVTETRWVGKSEPTTNCTSNEKRTKLIECLQNDRRVEVEIDYIQVGQMSDAR